MDDKCKIYEELLLQAKALAEDESDSIALMANIAALLHERMHFWWTGFYRVIGQELVLDPFQGPAACTRISFGRGVCGTAWQQQKTLIVPDVEQFAGHIACSSLSKSEIVVPVFKNHSVVAVLDIDSEHLNFFDHTDQYYLEKIANIISCK